MRKIDADELKKAIDTYDKFACLPDGKLYPVRNLEHPEMFVPYIHLEDIIKAIDNAPTVAIDEKIETYKNAYRIMSDAFENEVRKNKRQQGEWIGSSLTFGDILNCSICGARPRRSEYGYDLHDNFCPNCGASMKPKTCTNCETFGEGCTKCEEGDDD